MNMREGLLFVITLCSLGQCAASEAGKREAEALLASRPVQHVSIPYALPCDGTLSQRAVYQAEIAECAAQVRSMREAWEECTGTPVELPQWAR